MKKLGKSERPPMDTVTIEATLLDDMLGTKAASKEVFGKFIASKAPDEDTRKMELDSAENREEAGTTIFHLDEDGEPFLWPYQIEGFMKEAGEVLRQTRKSGTGKEVKGKEWGSIRSKIDNQVFVNRDDNDAPVKIRIKLPEGTERGVCERSLRVQTMQGPRVTLARSETVPAGSTLQFQVGLVQGGQVSWNMMTEILNYGRLKGLGQWRNSGKGSFTWKELVEDGEE